MQVKNINFEGWKKEIDRGALLVAVSVWGFLVVLMMVLSETEDRDVGESLSVGKS